ncbi:DNA-directed RNA polymerase III subunit RPC3-like [Uloborus diversus]|uniref:DNA-directed RNA polymerase III subunit RPC3-like n=1 Tax=Uloborus diversus TaxID=327109 RepID=UPI002409883E|nr:DNA-directed RNA polymerase III subunit RPC3-like [Uloborus diversus]
MTLDPYMMQPSWRLYGDPSDLLVEEILNHGRLTMSDTVQRVAERLQDIKEATDVDFSVSSIGDRFVRLVEGHFLVRCPYPRPSDETRAPLLSIPEREMYLVPQIRDWSFITVGGPSTDEPSTKRQKTEHPDCGIYWKVNHNRFKQYFRDDAIISACSNQLDEKASEILKTMLELSEQKEHPRSTTSFPVPHYEILQKTKMKSQELDAYLAVLSEGDASFVSKADDRGGGMFVVNILKVLQRLVEAMVSSVIQDRFGSKCARIFRILLAKKALEPKQIEELAMLHPKDSKEYIYRMFEENFILSHDVPKGSDFSHGHTFYLLRIDMIQVCRMLLERCYQALYNLLTCSELQQQENRRLLEKKERIDAIVASLKQSGAEEEQIREVQNILTPPEEAVITKVTEVTQKIDSSQIQISEMLLTLSIWLDYCSLK